MNILVLDAWAIMAWLKGQPPGAARVRDLLDGAERSDQTLLMNIVNLGEVYYLSVKAKDVSYGDRVLISLRHRVTTVAASDQLVMAAAKLKSRYALSYADAFAAATAMNRKAPLVTGDPELRAVAEVEPAFTVDWIAN